LASSAILLVTGSAFAGAVTARALVEIFPERGQHVPLNDGSDSDKAGITVFLFVGASPWCARAWSPNHEAVLMFGGASFRTVAGEHVAGYSGNPLNNASCPSFPRTATSPHNLQFCRVCVLSGLLYDGKLQLLFDGEKDE